MQMQPWLALSLAHEAQQREIERVARQRRAELPFIHPPIRRPPRHRGRSAHRRGAIARAGSVPLGAEPAPRTRGDPLVTIVAHELKASYAFIERNFFLTRRYWGWELAFLVYSVAGALSISLIGADQGDPELLLTLMVGAIFWNYLSVVFSWIAETISVERWEGTLEYTFMAPVRRWAQLLGSVVYAMGYGLVHTAVIFVVLVLFFRQLDFSQANPATAVVFMLLGSFSFVGIGMIAAILPLLYVERGAQMTFVLQSCLLLVSGVYYSVTVLPRLDAGALAPVAGDVRPRRRASRPHPRHAGE